MAKGRSTLRTLFNSCNTSVIALSLLTCLAIAASLFLASPLHPQYAAPLLPFLAALVAGLYGAVTASQPSAASAPRAFAYVGGALIPVAVLASLAFSSWGMLPHLRHLSANQYTAESPGEAWSQGDRTFIDEHALAARTQMRRVLGPPDKSLKVATLMSSYPVEAGFGIYSELAGAPFFYRVNERLTSEQLRQLRGLSPRTATA